MAAAKLAVSWLWSNSTTASLTAEKSSFVPATGIAAWVCGNNMKRNRLVRWHANRFWSWRKDLKFFMVGSLMASL